jgi:hypothetical protein
VIKSLPSKCKALCSNSSTTEGRKKGRKGKESKGIEFLVSSALREVALAVTQK